MSEEQTAGDTLGDMGEALKKDAEATQEHIEEAGEAVAEKLPGHEGHEHTEEGKE